MMTLGALKHREACMTLINYSPSFPSKVEDLVWKMVWPLDGCVLLYFAIGQEAGSRLPFRT